VYTEANNPGTFLDKLMNAWVAADLRFVWVLFVAFFLLLP